MPLKSTKAFSRRRSSSLKERFSINRGRKRFQSTRARIQSDHVRPGSDEESKSSVKYKFMSEMSVRVHALMPDSRNPWERLFNNSRFPWNWETHNINLGETEIYSSSAVGIFAKPIQYIDINDWTATSVPHLPFSYIKLDVGESTYLLQAPDPYQRDRILHSVQWKIDVRKFEKSLNSSHDPDILLSQLQELIKLTLNSPLYVDFTIPTLLEIVGNLLNQNKDDMTPAFTESLIMTVAPLLEEDQPSEEICNFFIKHCRSCPRSRVVIDIFLPVVLRILKYNNNYGKNLLLRNFVKEYILALSIQNDGESAVREFVQTVHGPLSFCPHKRILNNLFSVCLSGVYTSFSPYEEKSQRDSKSDSSDADSIQSGKENMNPKAIESTEESNSGKELWDSSLASFTKSKNCTLSHNINILQTNTNEVFTSAKADKEKCLDKVALTDWTPDAKRALTFGWVLDEISKMNDWLPGLATLLQPIPFQTEPMQCDEFLRILIQILERMVGSNAEKVIECLVGVRENRDGWLQIFSPHNIICKDDGAMFTKIAGALLESAKDRHKIKKLMKTILQSCFDAILLLALRESDVMIEILCYILEYKLADGQSEQQIVSTLCSTKAGNDQYNELCEKEKVLRQTGGPIKFTLPPRSTDEDLSKVLSNGKCNNLRELNLSCTLVTSKSADLIANLPHLQVLNLWSTLFDDQGVRRLCENLDLKCLNLCEVKVTDESIMYLKEMTNLNFLNLNSTEVTAGCFQELKQMLPKLKSWDVAYTDAYLEHSSSTQLTNASIRNNENTTVACPATDKLQYKQNI